FDPKPKLAELDGKDVGKVDNPTAIGNRKWLKNPWTFKQHGRSGLPVSELFPHLASCADELAVIRSMKADLPLHSTGVLYLHTGRPAPAPRPPYGLGSDTRTRPGSVVLSFGAVPCGGLETSPSGFLPPSPQAPLSPAAGPPIDTLAPADTDRRVQRAKLDLL